MAGPSSRIQLLLASSIQNPLFGQDKQDFEDSPGTNTHRCGYTNIRPYGHRLLWPSGLLGQRQKRLDFQAVIDYQTFKNAN